jgi:putative phage-type endonuclease
MITRVNIPKENYDEWLKFRTSGIGASEVGTILGLNPYKSATELFYQKIGKIPQKVDENLAMFMGNRLEPVVGQLWEYYDEDEAQFIKNFNEGTKTRHFTTIDGYLLNDKYPHLFFSPDGLIYNHSKQLPYLIDNEENVKLQTVKGILEIKTISGFASKQWETGVPPSYVVQIMTYMLGLELEYGEIAFFEDGRKLNVIELSRNEQICHQIITKTTEFWERVQAALSDIENCELYEPEPEGTTAYESFLNKKYSESEAKTIKGTDEMYELAHQHKMVLDEIKELEAKATECSNFLKSHMKECDTMDFGTGGKVTWKTGSRGYRTFKNSIKL